MLRTTSICDYLYTDSLAVIVNRLQTLRRCTPMNSWHQLVVFTLDEQRYAVPLSAVERIVRMVEITSVPQTPEIVLGVINVHGWIMPVVNLRRRFRLPEREPHPHDQLLIAHTSRRPVALVIDAVTEVVTLAAQDVVGGEKILAHLEYVAGVVKGGDGLILIHDLDRLLSLDEEHALHNAIDPIHP
jgi:purine-binding chemotaxis protein CheW